VIIEYNGQPIRNSDELVRLVANTAPGTDVPIKVVRDGRQTSLRVKVETLNFDEAESRAR
jgi:serine protease Do